MKHVKQHENSCITCKIFDQLDNVRIMNYHIWLLWQNNAFVQLLFFYCCNHLSSTNSTVQKRPGSQRRNVRKAKSERLVREQILKKMEEMKKRPLSGESFKFLCQFILFEVHPLGKWNIDSLSEVVVLLWSFLFKDPQGNFTFKVHKNSHISPIQWRSNSTIGELHNSLDSWVMLFSYTKAKFKSFELWDCCGV